MDLPESQSQIPENVSAPPPPQEVKIRTMRSDLASMAQSGGGLPQFQNVRIDAPAAEGESVVKSEKRISLGIAITIVAIIIILVVVGYLVYRSVANR